MTYTCMWPLQKKSSPGPDGWGLGELRSCRHMRGNRYLIALKRMDMPLRGISTLFRRIPVEKRDLDCPQASDVRPIDVFSHLIRAVSSSLVASLASWKRKVTHLAQYVSHHGTLAACANIGLVCEAVLHRHTKYWCVSIDFNKLFNVVSSQIAGMFAGYMGLSKKTVKALTGPLLSSRPV